MRGKRAILVLIFVASYTALSAETGREIAVGDGFVLTGVDGKLTCAARLEAKPRDSNEKWVFEFDSAISSEQGQIDAGASLELLPSSTLEKMAADTGGRNTAGYRLWGKVTKYKGRNFIFPIYFLPLSKVRQAEASAPQQPQSKEPQVIINEPEDSVALPEEIIAKIETRKIFQPEQPETRSGGAQRSPEGLELKQDTMLPERTGFITEKDGQFVFELDALGQSIQNISFQLLPCQVLEQLERTQTAALDPVRFKIAGIVTEYKGRNYLLLQRAIRAYSHDNFGR